jgi:hypothetical protein
MQLINIARLVFFIALPTGIALFPTHTFSQQDVATKQGKEINLKEEISNLSTKRTLLTKELESLKKNKGYEHDLPDIEIYIKAIDWLDRTKDFDQKDIFKKAKNLGYLLSTHLKLGLIAPPLIIHCKRMQSFIQKILVQLKQRNTLYT